GTIGEDTAVAALHGGASDFLVKGRLGRLVPAIERARREYQAHAAQRAAERAREESEERYRRIVETTNEGAWVVDAGFSTTFVNQRLAALLVREVSDVLGKSLLEFVHEQWRAAVASALEAPRPGASTQIEACFVRGDGKELWALLDSAAIFDGS